MPDRMIFGAPFPIVPPLHPLEMARALEGHDFGLGSQCDRRIPFDALNEITGHSLLQAVAPDQHVDPLGGLSQKHGGLTR